MIRGPSGLRLDLLSCHHVELPLMAATNKCLAQNNKSRHVSRATKDTNVHRPSERPGGPCAVRPASDGWCTVGAPDSSGEADAMSFLRKRDDDTMKPTKYELFERDGAIVLRGYAPEAQDGWLNGA